MKSLFTDVGFNLFLYCAIAFFTALSGGMSTDEAAKYISPVVLFWIRTVCTVSGATLLAAKMFLSTSYADYRAKKAGSSGGGSGDTTQFVLQPVPDQPKTVPGN